MAELLAFGSIAASVIGVVRYLTGGSQPKQSYYTLTPPVFDRLHAEPVLTHTPLEIFTRPRRRLFDTHYNGEDGERLIDARLRMAPQYSTDHHDFMAHIYLPKSQPGQPMRPLASARFHLQHQQDPNSFTNFILRTERGGEVAWNGAINLTANYEHMKETLDKQERSRALAEGRAPPSIIPYIAPLQLPFNPRGLSAFFNLPLFQVQRSPAASPIVRKPFDSSNTLQSTPTIGLRYDAPSLDNSGSYSFGLYSDPYATRTALDRGDMNGLKVGTWISQETGRFRVVGEANFQPLRPARDSAPASAAGSVEGAAVHPAAAALPPRLAASLPAMVDSKLGFFFTPTRVGHLRPGYEVGFTLSNDSRGRQELVASYFHHLVVRRNIKNPFEKKENRAINNYIDLGMEVVYKNDSSVSHLSDSSSLTPPSLRFGCSWQVNKNSLLKFRLTDSNISIVSAFKSWWEPSASFAVTANHSLHERATTFGINLSVENIGEVLFSKADPTYRRKIANMKEDITNRVELDEDY